MIFFKNYINKVFKTFNFNKFAPFTFYKNIGIIFIKSQKTLI